MTYDKTTKILLAFIASGVWANIVFPMLTPNKAHADSDYLLRNIESTLSSIESDISSVESDISRIQRGTCTNSKLC